MESGLPEWRMWISKWKVGEKNQPALLLETREYHQRVHDMSGLMSLMFRQNSGPKIPVDLVATWQILASWSQVRSFGRNVYKVGLNMTYQVFISCLYILHLDCVCVCVLPMFWCFGVYFFFAFWLRIWFESFCYIAFCRLDLRGKVYRIGTIPQLIAWGPVGLGFDHPPK